MALTIAPSGLRPARKLGAGYNNNGVNTYRIANNVTSAIYMGDLVKLTTTGTIIVSGVTSTDRPVGVFQGASWVDPVSKQKTWSNNVPAATSAYEGDIEALVIDDPNQTFYVYADASVSAGDIGLNFNVTASGGGNSSTGQSYMVLDGSTRTAAVNLLTAVGFAKLPNNAASDPTPLVEVKIARHAWQAVPVSAAQST